MRIVGDLQLDFALNQPLSPFALAAVELLDRESPDYPMDVLSVIEATLDDPRQVLARPAEQGPRRGRRGDEGRRHRVRGADGAARGRHATPSRSTSCCTRALETYRRGAPWVEDARLSPKSVARDMFERSMTFVEYVGALPARPLRGPGAALPGRRLPGAAPDRARRRQDRGARRRRRVARRAGPPGRLQPARRVGDARRGRGHRATGARSARPARPPRRPRRTGSPATPRAFRVLVRNALFRRVELAALRRWDLLGELDRESGWTAERWREAFEPYFAGARPDRHRPGRPRPADDRRSPRRPSAGSSARSLDDPAGDRDWAITAEVDLAASDESGEAVIWITAFGDRP